MILPAYKREAVIDTNQILNYTNRIEYPFAANVKKTFLTLNVSYYKWGFLPSLSAIGGYSLAYFNDSFFKLYNTVPNIICGLIFTFPIFTGR
jgi:hypothetical protein